MTRIRSNWRAILLAVVCVLAAAGCGDSHSSSSTASTRTTSTSGTTSTTKGPKLTDALRPPEAALLKPGGKVTISRATRNSVGWQVSCVAHGLRVNAESVRGQHTGAKRKNQVGAREIIGQPTPGKSPSIWVLNKDDGSLVISCR